MGYQKRIVDFDKIITAFVKHKGIKDRLEFNLLDYVPFADKESEILREKKVNDALDSLEWNGQNEDSGLSNYGIDFNSMTSIQIIKDKTDILTNELKDAYNQGQF
jgi:hypothetical protein